MQKKEQHFEISVFNGELTDKCLVENSKKLMLSFPALGGGFYEVLTDRLFANNYCDERLNCAIDYVIDNCIYPAPTIAQFISFDKHIKLYDYAQMLKLRDEVTQHVFSRLYKTVRVNGLDGPMWASINDIEKFGIELWKK